MIRDILETVNKRQYYPPNVSELAPAATLGIAGSYLAGKTLGRTAKTAKGIYSYKQNPDTTRARQGDRRAQIREASRQIQPSNIAEQMHKEDLARHSRNLGLSKEHEAVFTIPREKLAHNINEYQKEGLVKGLHEEVTRRKPFSSEISFNSIRNNKKISLESSNTHEMINQFRDDLIPELEAKKNQLYSQAYETSNITLDNMDVIKEPLFEKLDNTIDELKPLVSSSDQRDALQTLDTDFRKKIQDASTFKDIHKLSLDFKKLSRNFASRSVMQPFAKPYDLLGDFTKKQLIKFPYGQEAYSKIKEADQYVLASKIIEKILENMRDSNSGGTTLGRYLINHIETIEDLELLDRVFGIEYSENGQIIPSNTRGKFANWLLNVWGNEILASAGFGDDPKLVMQRIKALESKGLRSQKLKSLYTISSYLDSIPTYKFNDYIQTTSFYQGTVFKLFETLNQITNGLIPTYAEMFGSNVKPIEIRNLESYMEVLLDENIPSEKKLEVISDMPVDPIAPVVQKEINKFVESPNKTRSQDIGVDNFKNSQLNVIEHVNKFDESILNIKDLANTIKHDKISRSISKNLEAGLVDIDSTKKWVNKYGEYAVYVLTKAAMNNINPELPFIQEYRRVIKQLNVILNSNKGEPIKEDYLKYFGQLKSQLFKDRQVKHPRTEQVDKKYAPADFYMSDENIIQPEQVQDTTPDEDVRIITPSARKFALTVSNIGKNLKKASVIKDFEKRNTLLKEIENEVSRVIGSKIQLPENAPINSHIRRIVSILRKSVEDNKEWKMILNQYLLKELRRPNIQTKNREIEPVKRQRYQRQPEEIKSEEETSYPEYSLRNPYRQPEDSIENYLPDYPNPLLLEKRLNALNNNNNPETRRMILSRIKRDINYYLGENIELSENDSIKDILNKIRNLKKKGTVL